MQPDTRAYGIICGITEAELDLYKARLVAEGWIIKQVRQYQYHGSPMYYQIIVSGR